LHGAAEDAVKHIALLRDGRPCWNDVAEYLRDAHVKITPFDTSWDPDDVIDLSPDMIITNVRNLSHMKISLRRIPKVAVQVGEEEEHLLPTSKNEWNIRVVSWPTNKNDFLDVTSKQLAISPRKAYACIFQVFTGNGDNGITAQTVDISLTGIAFKTISEFEMGQRLRISLKLPDESSYLDAPAKIIRSAEDDSADPRTIYGAEYIDPPQEFSRVLKKFIHVY
jgi:hypothetical protein